MLYFDTTENKDTDSVLCIILQEYEVDRAKVFL